MIAIPESPEKFFLRELASLAKNNHAFKASYFLALELGTFDLALSFCEQSRVPAPYGRALQAVIQNASRLSFDVYKETAKKMVEGYNEDLATNVLTGFAAFLGVHRNMIPQTYQIYCLAGLGENAPLPPTQGAPLLSQHPYFNRATLESPAKILINTLMISRDLDFILGETKDSYLSRVSTRPEVLNQDAVDGEVKQKLYRYTQFPPRADIQEYARKLDKAFPDMGQGKK